MPRRYRWVKEMTRYNSNYGSHDQLQDLRKANMALHRENDGLKIRIITLLSKIDQLSDELAYYEALLQ
jgi:hypothetical protein